MKKNKKANESSNDVEYIQSIMDALKTKNQELENELNHLRSEYQNNVMENIDVTDELNTVSDESHTVKVLLRLQTLVLALFGLMQPFCAGTDYGRVFGKSIKDYYINILKGLLAIDVARHDEKYEDEYDEEDSEEEY